MEEADLEVQINEIELLKVLRHKNIVEFIEIIEDPQSIYIVLEFISGETLLKYIINRERLEDKHCKRVMRNIFEAIQYM